MAGSVIGDNLSRSCRNALATTGHELSEDLEHVLADCLARAAAAWPDVVVGEALFIRAIGERLHSGDPVRDIAAMHIEDLYLACGCTADDPAALAGFETSYGTVIARAIAASGISLAMRADLGQIVRQRLLVAPASGGVPRIATYSARGPLRSWVRVVATREAARMLSRARCDVTGDDSELADMIAGDDDPEIRYFKRLYHEEFKRALHAALDMLDDRLRLVLQQHVLDGLGIDQLAAVHRVHRSTAARWVQTAHHALRSGTQRELTRRLQLSPGELASVMRLIGSQLHVSLSRVLRHSA
jgi:RNA polymerase sigma-70 factor (ECF subfamily)